MGIVLPIDYAAPQSILDFDENNQKAFDDLAMIIESEKNYSKAFHQILPNASVANAALSNMVAIENQNTVLD